MTIINMHDKNGSSTARTIDTFLFDEIMHHNEQVC
jgi:hypothetical protein